MVEFVLIRISRGETGDRLVESRAGAQVCGNRESVAGAGVGTSQGPPTGSRVRMQADLAHRRQVSGRLPVPELADIEVVLLTIQALAALPAEEGVACRVRDPLALYDS